MRRRPAYLAVLTAVLVLAGRSNPACADSFNPNAPTTINTPGSAPYRLQDYTLSSSVDIPADPHSTGPQVVFNVSQGWVIVPAPYQDASGKTTDNPLLPPVSATGTALDPKTVVDGLNLAKGTPIQLQLGLAFNNGLKANSPVHFSLPVDPLLPTPQFSLSPDSSFVSDKKPQVTITPDAMPGAINTPEPLSVLVWSILAGLGLIRARGIRRSRPTPA
jgi:hypothetical protein